MHHDELYDKIKMLEEELKATERQRDINWEALYQAQQENEGLRKLVEKAYREGWYDYDGYSTKDECWNDSVAKKALEKLT